MSREKGNLAEAQARAYLMQNGFNIVEQNYYSRFGEIDIIASKNGVLHFIEVKSAPTYEQAINNITPAKLQKIAKTADIYMKKNALRLDYTIDGIIVTPKQISMIENITI